MTKKSKQELGFCDAIRAALRSAVSADPRGYQGVEERLKMGRGNLHHVLADDPPRWFHEETLDRVAEFLRLIVLAPSCQADSLTGATSKSNASIPGVPRKRTGRSNRGQKPS